MRTDYPAHDTSDFAPGDRVVCVGHMHARHGQSGTVQSTGQCYVHVRMDGQSSLTVFDPWDIIKDGFDEREGRNAVSVSGEST